MTTRTVRITARCPKCGWWTEDEGSAPRVCPLCRSNKIKEHSPPLELGLKEFPTSKPKSVVTFGVTESGGQKKLTPEQLKEIKGELVKNGVPVRFMRGGGSLNIVTGEATKRGTNVMHQIVYWNFTKETAKKVAAWLGVKAVFSKE